jgi:hydroxymethylpyrimidine pyrophosphatase-like HAD family hydrolase
MTSLRCAYIDLDGTLLGRGASLLHDGEGAVSLEGVRAVQACLRAGVEVVLMSGRRRAQVQEDARLLGQDSFIYESGACLVLGGGLQFGGEELWLTGELAPAKSSSAKSSSGESSSGESSSGEVASDESSLGEVASDELTIAEQIERSGAPALLLERYEGRLEYHEPWHVAREVSHLFRGLVDAGEADRLLAEHGFGHLRLVDNGVVTRRSPALAALEHVRGYHLVPAGASKAGAVALHMRVRGYAREETLAVGDSREDLACAEHVGTFWLVANAVARDPSIRATVGARENVRVAQAGHGAGVYEAVVSTLVLR